MLFTPSMRQRSIRRHCAVWLALFAAMLNALAPLAAYASARPNVLPLELCTAHGLSSADGETQALLPVVPPEERKQSWQCGCCATGCTAFLALTSEYHQAGVIQVAIEVRVVAPDTPLAKTPSWLSARPRGPPNA
jgi:hypothetical protein